MAEKDFSLQVQKEVTVKIRSFQKRIIRHRVSSSMYIGRRKDSGNSIRVIISMN
jgi:hypothetical protein